MKYYSNNTHIRFIVFDLKKYYYRTVTCFNFRTKLDYINVVTSYVLIQYINYQNETVIIAK